MKKLLTILSKKEIVTPVLILSVFSFMFFYSQDVFYGEGLSFSADIKKLDSIQANTLHKKLSTDTAAIQLLSIYKQVSIIKKPYMYLANNYFSYGSSFALVLCLSSVFTFILAFLLAKKGWDNSLPFLKVTFLTFSLITTFTSVAPKVFKNTENTAKNLDRFKTFNKMQYETYGYLINIHKYRATHLDSVIANLNMRLPEEQNFLFEMDCSKVPTKKELEGTLVE